MLNRRHYFNNYQSIYNIKKIDIPSLMRFFLPNVPILSQKLSSLSAILPEFGGRGDFGRGEVAMFIKIKYENK